MASKTSPSLIAKAGLSERELLVVAAAFSSLKSGDQTIDYNKFTALSGYASVNSARVSFRLLQKKLKAFVDSCETVGDAGNTIADVKAPVAPAGPKTAAAPGAKRRGRPKKRKLSLVEEAALGTSEDTKHLSDDVVKNEYVAGQVVCGEHGVTATVDALPEAADPPYMKIKDEGETCGETIFQVKWDVASEHSLGAPGNHIGVSVACTAEEPPKHQNSFYTGAFEPSLTFDEYIHRAGEGGQGGFDGRV